MQTAGEIQFRGRAPPCLDPPLKLSGVRFGVWWGRCAWSSVLLPPVLTCCWWWTSGTLSEQSQNRFCLFGIEKEEGFLGCQLSGRSTEVIRAPHLGFVGSPRRHRWQTQTLPGALPTGSCVLCSASSHPEACGELTGVLRVASGCHQGDAIPRGDGGSVPGWVPAAPGPGLTPQPGLAEEVSAAPGLSDFFCSHKNRGREGPAVTFGGGVSPALTGLPLARVPAGGRPCSACSCLAAFPSSPPCAALLAVCAGRGRQLGPVGLRAPRGSARCSNLYHSATWGHPAVGWGQVGEPPVGAGCAPGTRHRPRCLPTSADVLVTRVCKPAAGYRSLPVQHPGVGAGGPDRVRGRTTLCPASLQGHKGPGVTTAPGARA